MTLIIMCAQAFFIDWKALINGCCLRNLSNVLHLSSLQQTNRFEFILPINVFEYFCFILRTIIHVRIRVNSRVQPIPNSSIGSSTMWHESERSSKSLVSDGRWTKTSCYFVRRVSNRSKRQPKVSNQTNDRQRENSIRDVENIDVSSGDLGIVDDHHRTPSTKKKKWVVLTSQTLWRSNDDLFFDGRCPPRCIVVTIVIVICAVAGITNVSGTATNLLSGAYDVLFDASNTLYISDTYNNRVQKWSFSSSTGITAAGRPNGVACTFMNCTTFLSNLFLDSLGGLYVPEVGRVRVTY